MVKVMVNGATGLVGTAIVESFLEDGHTVRVSDLPGSDFRELEKLGLEIIPADIGDVDGICKTVEGMDIVVNVAGIFDFGADPALLEAVNHQGVRNVCEAVLKTAPNLSRLLQISTVGTYGRPVNKPCQEDDPKQPGNAYEQAKWRGEQAAFEYHEKHGLPVSAIRPTLVYGPKAKYGHAMFIGLMALIKASGQERLISLRSGPETHHVHIEDVGRGAKLVALHEDSIGLAYNMVDLNPVDGLTFTKALAEPMGLEVLPLIPYFGPVAKLMHGVAGIMPQALLNFINKRMAKQWDELKEQHGLTDDLRPRLDQDWIDYMLTDHVYDNTRLKDLGMEWKHPDLVQGLKETIEWYREHEWIP